MEKEKEWINRQIKWIDEERDIAKTSGTKNGQQSALIYTIWRTQLMLRKRDLDS